MSAAATHSHKVGDIEVIAVADGERVAPVAPGFVLNAPFEEVKASFNAAGTMPKDQFRTIFTPSVIKTGKRIVVVDTGMGEGAAAQPGATFGFLMRNLASIGISKDDVTDVIISHFHGDHVNGLLAPGGGSAFPKAQITVPENEWNFWMNDEQMGRASEGRMADLFKNNRRVFDPLKSQVTTHAWGKEAVPGVTAMGTPGHSIGHTSYMVSSGGKSLFLLQDVANNPVVSLYQPTWHLMFDQDPVQAEKTRFKTFDMLATDKLPIHAFHFPFPGFAYVEKHGKAYRDVPIS